MRFKFFLISLGILTSLAITTFVFDRYVVYRELYSEVDGQLETMAASIFASGLSSKLLNNFENTDDGIRTALEDQRIDRTIRLFNLEGRLLFKNELGNSLSTSASRERWSMVKVHGQDIRILTLSTEKYILEIGIVLQPFITKVDAQIRDFGLIILFVVCLATALSYWLSGLVVLPVNNLANTFSVLKGLGINSGDFSKINSDPRMENLKNLTRSKDDVGFLAQEVVTLFNHLHSLHESHRKDLFYLAHELKTPLTRIVFDAESLLATRGQANKEEAESLKNIREVCKNMATFTDEYLRIAAVRSSLKAKENLVAINLSKLADEVIAKSFSDKKERVSVKIHTPITIFAEPTYIQSAITNLLQNALTYTSGAVEIILDSNTLTVLDYGPGLPEPIEKRLGETFNRSSNPKSTGLGLAFVHSVCDLYGWELKYTRTNSTTQFQIVFTETA